MNKKLQVFVSSTYTDLIEERQTAVEAILDAGHIPAGMELFKAGNESQLETIYKWIDESDVYMLILGGRYGSLEPTTGKSYTQLEYEYALSQNIPVFAVVLSDSFITSKINSIGLTNTMEQIAPNKYQEFKSLVMSKIIRKADDCKDIKIIIYSTLNEFIYKYNLTGWVRGNNNGNNQVKNEKHIDEYYFMKLIEIFQNKQCNYTHSTILGDTVYTFNVLDIFIRNYFLFCIGIPKSYIYDSKMSKLFYEICIYFEHFNLLEEIKIENLQRIKISKLGKSFYKLLKSQNMTNIYMSP